MAKTKIGGGSDGVANSESNSVSLNVYYLNVKDQGLGSFMPPPTIKKSQGNRKAPRFGQIRQNF